MTSSALRTWFFLIRLRVVTGLTTDRDRPRVPLVDELAVRSFAPAGDLREAVREQVGDEFADFSWHAASRSQDRQGRTVAV